MSKSSGSGLGHLALVFFPFFSRACGFAAKILSPYPKQVSLFAKVWSELLRARVELERSRIGAHPLFETCSCLFSMVTRRRREVVERALFSLL